MKHRIKNLVINAVIVCIYLFSFTGCMKNMPSNETNPSIENGKISAPASTTPQDTPTFTDLSVITPANTSAVSPPTTATVPPRSLEEAINDVETCMLPCMLGINPGETSWESAVHLIKGFRSYSKEETAAINGKQQEFITWHYPDLSKSEVGGYVASENGVVIKMKLLIESGQNHRYSIKEILQTHGPPDQVMISTKDNGLEPTWRMSIFMLYPSQKFVVFSGLEASRKEDFVIGCKEYNSVGIFSYSEEINWTEKKISELFFGALSSFKIRSISEATTLDTESFYQLYMSEENNGRCIQTPSSIWN